MATTSSTIKGSKFISTYITSDKYTSDEIIAFKLRLTYLIAANLLKSIKGVGDVYYGEGYDYKNSVYFTMADGAKISIGRTSAEYDYLVNSIYEDIEEVITGLGAELESITFTGTFSSLTTALSSLGMQDKCKPYLTDSKIALLLFIIYWLADDSVESLLGTNIPDIPECMYAEGYSWWDDMVDIFVDYVSLSIKSDGTVVDDTEDNVDDTEDNEDEEDGNKLFGLSTTSLMIIGAAAFYWFKIRKS